MCRDRALPLEVLCAEHCSRIIHRLHCGCGELLATQLNVCIITVSHSSIALPGHSEMQFNDQGALASRGFKSPNWVSYTMQVPVVTLVNFQTQAGS